MLDNVGRFLDYKADTNAQDELGDTALHVAAYLYVCHAPKLSDVCSSGYAEIAKALLGAGAEVDALNEASATPLHKVHIPSGFAALQYSFLSAILSGLVLWVS